jgi:hypothetical protein
MYVQMLMTQWIRCYQGLHQPILSSDHTNAFHFGANPFLLVLRPTSKPVLVLLAGVVPISFSATVDSNIAIRIIAVFVDVVAIKIRV